MSSALTDKDIRRLFELLNEELAADAVVGELFLVGGAVMCLVYKARAATRDVDAFFRPSRQMREAAARVALRADIEPDWLNDAVKGFLSDHGEFDRFVEMDRLRVMVAQPAYLLAMKCLSMRIGTEFHDEEDVRFLLRYLNIEAYERALKHITRYYPLERFPQKTLYALEDSNGSDQLAGRRKSLVSHLSRQPKGEAELHFHPRFTAFPPW